MYGNGFSQTHLPFQQNVLAQLDINSYNVYSDISAKEQKYIQNFNYEVARKTNATYSFLSMSSSDNEKQLNISSAMLLVPNEISATLDKRELRNLGILNINIYTSGIEAANALAQLTDKDPDSLPELILCQEQLSDMSSSEFVVLIRNHPQLLGIPVIALAAQSSVIDEVNALAVGFSGLVVRPYSSSTLKSTIIESECQALFIEKLKQIHMPTTADKFDNALKKINYVKSIEHMPMEYFKEGLNFLRQKKWDHSIRIFQKSIRQAGIKGNSELGLAAAYKGKLNIKKYRHYLNMACLTFAKNKQWDKARTVYMQLLKDDPTAVNPFIQLAEFFIKGSKFDAAASAIIAGHDLGPSTNMARVLAQACSYLKSQEEAIKTLIEHLRGMDMPDLALQLQEQIILGELNKIKKEKEEKQHLLKQIVVAKDLRSKHILRNLNSDNKELVDLITMQQESIKIAHDPGLTSLPFDDGHPTKKAAPLLLNENLKNDKRTSMSGLSEMLTVAKMTWKLFRK